MVSLVEQSIFDCIDSTKSFILDAGAGSGKTWALVQALNYVIETKSKVLTKRNQKIICITYTNIAKDEIIERTEHNDLIIVSTIHDFLWDCIKNYQKEVKSKLLELIAEKILKEEEKLNGYTARAVKSREKSDSKILKYNEAKEILESQNLKINYDNYTSYKKGKFSHDALIIIAERIFAEHPKIRKIIADTYPIIFIDEYQDTQKETVLILLEHMHGRPNFMLGFFGDKRQQIYDAGIGEIPNNYDLELIQKKENFRSSKEVIELLNKLRDDLIQEQPENNQRRGKIKFCYTPNIEEFNANEFIESNLKDLWSLQSNSEVKVLYLIHRFIARENNYEEIYALHSKNADIITKNKDNRGLSPFTDILFDIEEICTLYKENRTQSLLKKLFFDVTSFESKKELNKLMSTLIEIREKEKIGNVIKYIFEKQLLPKSEGIKDYDFDDEDKKKFYDELIDIDYAQFMRLYQVQQDNTPFSTKHNTKGDEFDNVLVVVDDNSKFYKYNFEEYFAGDESKIERYNLTRNLFYVVCSRAMYNLAIACVSTLSDRAKANIKEWFGEENYIELC
jgi:DNA helicase-2/ATP-dependent DNA helicase PcrA